MTTTTDTRALDELAINTIRTLSMDGVQKANSGHPGAPMALAPVAYVLYTRVMKHNPRNADWFDRDRFVLSAGHASMLLYSMLHLCGYGLTIDDLKNFRQLGSPTAGHPEYGDAAGIEATTGPLGQGISNAVGLALAEAMLAARYNRDGHELIDHYTYTIASDGDLQEGVSAEACSLGGHLGLGKLIAFYDDNKIQLAGPTSVAFTEDVAKRYEAYGWHVQNLGEDLELDNIERAVDDGQGRDRPAEPDHGPHAHRRGVAEQARLPRGARLAARRGRSAPDEGGLRLGPRRPVPRAGRGGRALRGVCRSRVRGGGRVERAGGALPRRARRGVGGAVADHRAPAARRLGPRGAEVPARGRHDRHPQGLPRRDPVGGRRGAASRERLGGPGAVDAHADRGRRLGSEGRLHGAQRALRRARARHGRDRQRPLPARPEGVRLDLLQLLGLHEGRHAARVDHAPALDLRVHARLDRTGGGRPDPPARRAAGAPARHPEPLRRAPGRGQRDGAGLALRHRADGGARVARVQPPGPAGVEPGRRAGGRHPSRRLRAARVLQGSRARPDPDRHRLRGAPLHGGGRRARGRRDRHAGGVDALLGPLRGAGPGLHRQRPAALGARAGVGRGGGDARLGALDRGGRRADRDAQLRGFGAPAGPVRALRLHPENIVETGKKVVEKAGARA